MTWMQDRQNRRYAVFLAGICLALAAVFFIVCADREIRIRDSLLKWERAAASSLLEPGCPGRDSGRSRLKIQRQPGQGKSSCERLGIQKRTELYSRLSGKRGRRSRIFIGAAGLGVCFCSGRGRSVIFEEERRRIEHCRAYHRQYAEGDSRSVSPEEREGCSIISSALWTACQLRFRRKERKRRNPGNF